MAPILIPGCKTFGPCTSRYACVYSCTSLCVYPLYPEASPFRNEGRPHYNDMVDLNPTANTGSRRRPLTRKHSNNGDDDVDLNGIDPKKSESSENSQEESFDSETYAVLAEAVRLAVMCAVECLKDDDFLIEALKANPEESAAFGLDWPWNAFRSLRMT